MEALPDDSELVGGSESRFTIRLEANLETLQELHQEVLADWQAGRPNERIMQLLNDRQQELSPGRFVSSTPTRFVTTTNAERQAGQLAETLKGFVKNSGVTPISETQRIYFRILASREFCRGLVLFHRLFGAIADPMEDLPAWNEGKQRDQFLWIIDLDVAIFQLMNTGELEFRQFLEQEGIDCPFSTTLDIFLDSLKDETKKHMAEVVAPQAINKSNASSKKQKLSLKKLARDEERKFRKFLNCNELPKEAETEYTEQLRAGGWQALALLALREHRYSKKLEQRWKNYLKARQQAEPLFISTEQFWDQDGELWQRANRNQKRKVQFQWTEDGKLISKGV